MSRLTQKFIAVFFAVWLPLFSGSALAASVSMSVPAGHCQDQSMQMADMGDMDMSEHDPALDSVDESSCVSCTVCHLACTAYLAVPVVVLPLTQSAARASTPYLLIFSSRNSVPLLPPPLALV